VFLQSTALIIILELLRLEYCITGYALLHCSNLVDLTLSFRPSRGADAGQQKPVTMRSYTENYRQSYSIRTVKDWNAVPQSVVSAGSLALADCPVTSHHSRAPRWCDASVLRPCRLMIKNKKKKKKLIYSDALEQGFTHLFKITTFKQFLNKFLKFTDKIPGHSFHKFHYSSLFTDRSIS